MMIRALSFLGLAASLVAFGWSAFGFYTKQAPQPASLPRVATDAQRLPLDPRDRIAPAFLAIYGTPQAEPLQTGAVSAPAPQFPYALKGLVAVGEARWAILSTDGDDLVVREGEVLDDGTKVSRIGAEGIDLATDKGPMTLRFNADAPVEMARVPAPVIAPDVAGPKGNFNPGPQTAVLFQDMSSEDILAALQKAEERRAARGWVTGSD